MAFKTFMAQASFLVMRLTGMGLEALPARIVRFLFEMFKNAAAELIFIASPSHIHCVYGAPNVKKKKSIVKSRNRGI
jgi:hypothetical protein